MSQTLPNKIFVFLSVFFLLYFAQDLILPVFLTILFYLILFRVVNFLKRRFSIPDYIGAAALILIFFASFGFCLYYLFANINLFIADLKNLIEISQNRLESFVSFFQIPNSVLEIFHDMNTKLYEKIPENLVIPIFNSTWQFLGSLVMIAVLLYFLLISEGLFLKRILRTLPIYKGDEKVNGMIHKLEKDMSNYFITKSLINISVGIVIGLILFIFQISNAALIGILVGVLEFIPFFGSIISVILISLIAIASLEQSWQIILTLSLVIAIMIFEGNFFTPYVISKRFFLNNVAVILGVFIMGWMWGVIGLFLAVPFMIIVKVILDNIKKDNLYSEMIRK